MEPIRKNIGTILVTLLVVALAVAVIHLIGHARSTPDQIGYAPWTPTPAALVSTPAAAPPSPAASEPEDGGSDSGGDG